MRAIHTQLNGPNRTASSRGSLTASAVATAMIVAGLVVVSYPVAAVVTGGFVLILRHTVPRLVQAVRTVDPSTEAPTVGTSASQTQQ